MASARAAVTLIGASCLDEASVETSILLSIERAPDVGVPEYLMLAGADASGPIFPPARLPRTGRLAPADGRLLGTIVIFVDDGDRELSLAAQAFGGGSSVARGETRVHIVTGRRVGATITLEPAGQPDAGPEAEPEEDAGADAPREDPRPEGPRYEASEAPPGDVLPEPPPAEEGGGADGPTSDATDAGAQDSPVDSPAGEAAPLPEADLDPMDAMSTDPNEAPMEAAPDSPAADAMCSALAPCTPGSYCLAGACVAKKSNGSGCDAALKCLSGTCLDSVCCAAVACPECFTCNGTSPGSCTPLTSGDLDYDGCYGGWCIEGTCVMPVRAGSPVPGNRSAASPAERCAPGAPWRAVCFGGAP